MWAQPWEKKPTVHKRLVEDSEPSVPGDKEALTEVTVKCVMMLDAWMVGWMEHLLMTTGDEMFELRR